MKKSIVNAKAAQRRKSKENYAYGLPVDHETTYTSLAAELKAFYKFMTEPSTLTQEEPIRPATAQIYHRHAKLFLGWFLHTNHHESIDTNNTASISIYSIIPSKDKESAQSLIDFVLWLRRERNISDAYEANLLRGLIKFLKFRFAKESATDSSYGGLTFTDIPLIKELRKLHRAASQKSKVAPKSSDEQKKWLSWPEFLSVIQKTKEDTMTKIENYRQLNPTERRFRKGNNEFSLQEEEIAALFQKYLILAIFANIPDRQRTIRELEIGRTLMKEDGYWFVKHGPDDYKTGKVYGERPALQLSPELTPAIDEFINLWRPALQPSTNYLFVQTRTGKPMTGDSIFQRVNRSCFKYTGKRTNPHLLRSMIITHVREESNASEKELEALALFMGHSIQMQRSSYDKRTLKKKIAPAVQLIQSVNQNVSPS
jgi:integrase